MAADPLREFAGEVIDSAVAGGLLPRIASQKRVAELTDAIVGYAAEVLASAAAVAGQELLLPTGSSPGSPPVAAAPDPELQERLRRLAYSAAVLLGLHADLSNLVGSWGTAPKVVHGVTMAVAAALLAIGITSAGRLSTFCARLSSILSSDLLVISISCKMGRHGWLAGVPAAAVTGGVMTALWVREEPAAAAAVSATWGGVAKLMWWRREERAGAEAAPGLWGRVVELCRWMKQQPAAPPEEGASLPTSVQIQQP